MDRDYYDDVTEMVKDTTRDQVLRVLYSTVIYITSYILVTYVHQYAKGLMSIAFEYEPTINYYGIYNLPISASQWTKWGVLFVFTIGPVVGLLVGLASLQINAYLREANTIIKVYALWISIHGVALFASFCITGTFGTGDYTAPFYYGFAVVASWLHLDKGLMIPVTLMGILLLIGFGLMIIVAFLSLSFSRKLAINYKGRREFLLQTAFLPWLFGSIVTVLISLPPNMAMRDFMVHFFRNGSIIFILMGMRFRLDYIVGSIQVHSFDVFKKRPVFNTMIMLGLILIVLKRHINNLFN